jgi:glutaredoxin 3
MRPVTIYTRPFCGYCHEALSILQAKGADIHEISALDPQSRAEMLARSAGARTYPQIFIGQAHIGGCDELMALDAAGRLDALLREEM